MFLLFFSASSSILAVQDVVTSHMMYFLVSRRHFIVFQLLMIGIALAKSNAPRYERRGFQVKVDQNSLAGFPRTKLNAAWHELFKGERP